MTRPGLLVAAGLWLVAAAALAAPAERELVIFHVNDVHGYIDSRRDSEGESYGGVARLASALKSGKRAALRRGARWLFVAGGDLIQGTPVADDSQGKAVIPLLNGLGLVATAVGNHEFDFGPEALACRAREARFRILAGNVVHRPPDPSLWASSILVPVGELRVGLAGLTTTETKTTNTSRSVRDFDFMPRVPVAGRMLLELRERRADVTVLLTHEGLSTDQALATSVPGFDLIVGGHSHTPATSPTFAGDTAIVQAGENCEYLGEVRLAVTPGEHRVRLLGYRLIPLRSPAIEPEPAVEESVRALMAPIEEEMARVAGELSVPLAQGLPGDYSEVSALVADAVREAHPADVSIFHPRGIRRGLPAGPLTVRGLREVLPYGNRLVTFELDGNSLRRALERGLAGPWAPYTAEDGPWIAKRLGRPPPGGPPPGRSATVTGLKPTWAGMIHLQASGLTYSFDPTRPDGQRLVDVQVGGAPLDGRRTYTLVSNTYLVDDCPDRPDLALGRNVRIFEDKDRDAVLRYLERHRPYVPPVVPSVVNLANRVE